MDIEQIVEERRKLQQHILREVQDFELRTGMSCRSGIELQHCHTVDGKSTVVDVSVRLILPGD